MFSKDLTIITGATRTVAYFKVKQNLRLFQAHGICIKETLF